MKNNTELIQKSNKTIQTSQGQHFRDGVCAAVKQEGEKVMLADVNYMKYGSSVEFGGCCMAFSPGEFSLGSMVTTYE